MSFSVVAGYTDGWGGSGEVRVYMVSKFGPPQISRGEELQVIWQAVDEELGEVVWFKDDEDPTKHCPPYSKPAHEYGPAAAAERQASTVEAVLSCVGRARPADGSLTHFVVLFQ